MHYVIGDIHGCYREMMALLNKIESRDPEAQYIFVGDFIDRGDGVWDVLQWFVNNVTPDGKYQSICGNHEYLVMKWYEKFCDWWYGGHKDMVAMPRPRYDFADWAWREECLNPVELQRYIQFFRSLPLEKQVTVQGAAGEVRYRIVHAWIPDGEEPGSVEEKLTCLFERHYTGNTKSDDIIVFGHTPTVSEDFYSQDLTSPGLIAYRKNAVNVDGGCVYKTIMRNFPCMLCAICLETLEEIYPYTIEERIVMQNPGCSKEILLEVLKEYYGKYYVRDNPYKNEMLKRLKKE